jgi:hypothetical protein
VFPSPFRLVSLESGYVNVVENNMLRRSHFFQSGSVAALSKVALLSKELAYSINMQLVCIFTAGHRTGQLALS